jgi:methylsterol monooxygenase/4-alpha-methyl-delta7-sterol-4alpha-methyl oxidase
MAKSKPKQSPPVLQGSLSIWTLVAALQSTLWFFAIPPLLKPYWSSIFAEFSSSSAEIILFLLITPFYVAYITVVAVPPYLLQWDFFEQYKISKEPWPWLDDRQSVRNKFWDLTKKTIAVDSFGLLFMFPIMLYVKTIIVPNTELSFSDDDWPTYTKSCSDLATLGLLHEFFFYWSHRIMHMFPQLYKFHKVHHEYKQNDVLAAQYFHPIDFIFCIGGPAIIVTLLVHPHSITQFQFGLWLLYANFDDHLGYNFPWSPVRWFPLAAATEAHEFHHSVNLGCFSSKLALYDMMFGTDKAYHKWQRNRM